MNLGPRARSSHEARRKPIPGLLPLHPANFAIMKTERTPAQNGGRPGHTWNRRGPSRSLRVVDRTLGCSLTLFDVVVEIRIWIRFVHQREMPPLFSQAFESVLFHELFEQDTIGVLGRRDVGA